MDKVQVDIEQRRGFALLSDDVAVPDFFDDRAGFHYIKRDATASPTSDVVAGLPVGLRSTVTRPELSTASTAAFTAPASSFKPKLYSSMAATDPMAPNGFALFCP